tara:strand:- start:1816 stop:2010 length:195 start_codon:yes stop_codon:yes gene_type:complete
MIKEIKEIVEETLYTLDMYSDDALTLIMRTGWAESGYRSLGSYKWKSCFRVLASRTFYCQGYFR